MEIADRDREMVTEFRAAVDKIVDLLNEAQNTGLCLTYEIDYQRMANGQKVYYVKKAEGEKIEKIRISES